MKKGSARDAPRQLEWHLRARGEGTPPLLDRVVLRVDKAREPSLVARSGGVDLDQRRAARGGERSETAGERASAADAGRCGEMWGDGWRCGEMGGDAMYLKGDAWDHRRRMLGVHRHTTELVDALGGLEADDDAARAVDEAVRLVEILEEHHLRSEKVRKDRRRSGTVGKARWCMRDRL